MDRDARETVLQHMDEEVGLLNLLALFAEQSGMPGSAAVVMQCAESIERAAGLERAGQEELLCVLL